VVWQSSVRFTDVVVAEQPLSGCNGPKQSAASLRTRRHMAGQTIAQVQLVRAQVGAWLEQAVIGLNLCPFAGAVHRAGQIRVAVTDARNPSDAIEDALRQARLLIDGGSKTEITTLVVVPHTLQDFETYLDAVSVLEEMLSESGADGILQVASMHPRYCFEGEGAESLSHYTNRSPHPIFHLLREQDVSLAVDSHPDPASIPDTNIATLEIIGAEGLAKLWSGWDHAAESVDGK
jgi:hypothetical protein